MEGRLCDIGPLLKDGDLIRCVKKYYPTRLNVTEGKLYSVFVLKDNSFIRDDFEKLTSTGPWFSVFCLVSTHEPKITVEDILG